MPFGCRPSPEGGTAGKSSFVNRGKFDIPLDGTMINLTAFAVIHGRLSTAILDVVARAVDHAVMAAIICAFKLNTIYKGLAILAIDDGIIVEVDV